MQQLWSFVYNTVLWCVVSISISLFSQIHVGFLSGTLVKTPDGDVPIDRIFSGDTVFVRDASGQCVSSTVTHHVYAPITQYVCLTLSDDTVYADGEQPVYVYEHADWVQARKKMIHVPAHVQLRAVAVLAVNAR